MAEEIDKESKTEDATPRRREEARKQGRVPFSAELVGSLVLLAGVIGLMTVGPGIGSGMLEVFRHDLTRLFHSELTTSEATSLFQRVAVQMLAVLSPLFGILLGVGILASAAQVGFQINGEKLEPNFDKLNPAEGFKKLFSMPALVRGLLTILKVLALAGIAYWVVEGRIGTVTGLGGDRLAGATLSAWAVVLRLALYLAIAVAGVSLIDYIYQRRKFEQTLRMTKQELKEEMKEEDGDPQIKGRIRQIQRDRARQRMLREVPKATVVLTNPTHYAVALRYNGAKDSAPVVVARGMGPMAKRIISLARDYGVPTLERPTLTRAIYSGVKEGHAIPNELFRAVAEILAFVYRVQGRSTA